MLRPPTPNLSRKLPSFPFSLGGYPNLWCVIAQAFCSQKSFREITLNSAEKTLDFREISEAPRLKKAWAITHPTNRSSGLHC